MKFFKKREPQRYTLPSGQRLTCPVCQGQTFDRASHKLNTTSMEFMKLGWADSDATCMICADCRHILWFAF